MTIRNNQEIICKSLNSLSQGLYPYIVKEMEENYPNDWVKVARPILNIAKKSDLEKTLSEDVSLQLKLIVKKWDDVFKKNKNLSKAIVEELIEVRNKWAHITPFSIDDTYRALDSIARLIKTIEAEVEEVEKEKQEVLRILSQQQFRYENIHTPSVSPEEEKRIKKRLNEILEKISFENPSILEIALTHRTYLYENPTEVSEDNNRLEFLGDALLNFLSGEYLYRKYPKMKEGEMTQKRSSLVDNQQLAKFAIYLNLGQFILLSKGEESQGGRENNSLLSDAFEAVIGAYYIDSGIEAVRNFLEPIFAETLKNSPDYVEETESINTDNPIGFLQEMAQKKFKIEPKYEVERNGGSDNQPEYIAMVLIDGEDYGEGLGSSKKEAKKQAAKNALAKLKQEGLI
ncbi:MULTISPECIES: ribonuclease III [Okeania]|uniref:Ribonuclease 3 n=1 Tax=Okeania hirsuta TaxID=1458930 RepID=A0A3N6PWE4_9CYAN|nr:MULTISPECIES: ribonuclease III [Okeania]NET78881.1 ribonuclease III [Okeania sp. SIO1F9]RQH19781.1 ribonuclease III [Okeania hirsuta]RQH44970.1 ribonuclease III [Okeania hirsuta]